MSQKFLIDLDGTLLNGCDAIDGAKDFIDQLQVECVDFLIMTNSIKSPKLIAKRLLDVGICVDEKLILNPITAINNYLNTQGISSAYIVGSHLEIEQVVVPHNSLKPEIIILLDFEKESFGYDKLQEIFDFICRGVPVVSASKSTFYLTDGMKKLDTGAFVSLLESTGQCRIEVFGKPSKAYFGEAITLLGADKSEITVLGDDVDTDITGAINSGLNAVLVQSGKYNSGDEEKFPNISTVKHLNIILNNEV